MPYYNCYVSGCTNNFRNVGKRPRCHIRHIGFFVPPNKRLDPVLCSIGKWLITGRISIFSSKKYTFTYSYNPLYLPHAALGTFHVFFFDVYPGLQNKANYHVLLLPVEPVETRYSFVTMWIENKITN